MKQTQCIPLTSNQKKAIKERLDDNPMDIAEQTGANYEQVRNYQWHQRKRVEDISSFCPITGYKKY